MDGVPTGPASRRRGHSPVGAADMGDRPAEVGSGCAGRSPVRRMRLGELLFGPADWPVGLGGGGRAGPLPGKILDTP